VGYRGREVVDIDCRQLSRGGILDVEIGCVLLILCSRFSYSESEYCTVLYC